VQQGGVLPVDAVCTTFILRHGTLMPCDITGVVSVHILRRLYLKQKLQNLKGIGTNGEGHLLGMSPHKWLQYREFHFEKVPTDETTWPNPWPAEPMP